MNTAAAVAATPATAVCALPMLGFALRHLEALHAGQPLPQSPETEGLPTDVAGLIAFCIRRYGFALRIGQTRPNFFISRRIFFPFIRMPVCSSRI